MASIGREPKRVRNMATSRLIASAALAVAQTIEVGPPSRMKSAAVRMGPP